MEACSRLFVSKGRSTKFTSGTKTPGWGSLDVSLRTAETCLVARGEVCLCRDGAGEESLSILHSDSAAGPTRMGRIISRHCIATSPALNLSLQLLFFSSRGQTLFSQSWAACFLSKQINFEKGCDLVLLSYFKTQHSPKHK